MSTPGSRDAVPLAVGAGIAGAINMRAARGPPKRRYRIAITLSVITILVGFLLRLGVVAGSGTSTWSDDMIEQPAEPEPDPIG